MVTKRDLFYYAIPAVITIFSFYGYLNFIYLFRDSPKETFGFIWNTILFSFIVGTLVLSTKSNKDMKWSGFVVILSGLIMSFGLALQGFHLSITPTDVTSKIATGGDYVATFGAFVLFYGLAFFFVRLAEEMFKK